MDNLNKSQETTETVEKPEQTEYLKNFILDEKEVSSYCFSYSNMRKVLELLKNNSEIFDNSFSEELLEFETEIKRSIDYASSNGKKVFFKTLLDSKVENICSTLGIKPKLIRDRLLRNYGEYSVHGKTINDMGLINCDWILQNLNFLVKSEIKFLADCVKLISNSKESDRFNASSRYVNRYLSGGWSSSNASNVYCVNISTHTSKKCALTATSVFTVFKREYRSQTTNQVSSSICRIENIRTGEIVDYNDYKYKV